MAFRFGFVHSEILIFVLCRYPSTCWLIILPEQLINFKFENQQNAFTIISKLPCTSKGAWYMDGIQGKQIIFYHFICLIKPTSLSNRYEDISKNSLVLGDHYSLWWVQCGIHLLERPSFDCKRLFCRSITLAAACQVDKLWKLADALIY